MADYSLHVVYSLATSRTVLTLVALLSASACFLFWVRSSPSRPIPSQPLEIAHHPPATATTTEPDSPTPQPEPSSPSTTLPIDLPSTDEPDHEPPSTLDAKEKKRQKEKERKDLRAKRRQAKKDNELTAAVLAAQKRSQAKASASTVVAPPEDTPSESASPTSPRVELKSHVRALYVPICYNADSPLLPPQSAAVSSSGGASPARPGSPSPSESTNATSVTATTNSTCKSSTLVLTPPQSSDALITEEVERKDKEIPLQLPSLLLDTTPPAPAPIKVVIPPPATSEKPETPSSSTHSRKRTTTSGGVGLGLPSATNSPSTAPRHRRRTGDHTTQIQPGGPAPYFTPVKGNGMMTPPMMTPPMMMFPPPWNVQVQRGMYPVPGPPPQHVYSTQQGVGLGMGSPHARAKTSIVAMQQRSSPSKEVKEDLTPALTSTEDGEAFEEPVFPTLNTPTAVDPPPRSPWPSHFAPPQFISSTPPPPQHPFYAATPPFYSGTPPPSSPAWARHSLSLPGAPSPVHSRSPSPYVFGPAPLPPPFSPPPLQAFSPPPHHSTFSPPRPMYTAPKTKADEETSRRLIAAILTPPESEGAGVTAEKRTGIVDLAD